MATDPLKRALVPDLSEPEVKQILSALLVAYDPEKDEYLYRSKKDIFFFAHPKAPRGENKKAKYIICKKGHKFRSSFADYNKTPKIITHCKECGIPLFENGKRNFTKAEPNSPPFARNDPISIKWLREADSAFVKLVLSGFIEPEKAGEEKTPYRLSFARLFDELCKTGEYKEAEKNIIKILIHEYLFKPQKNMETINNGFVNMFRFTKPGYENVINKALDNCNSFAKLVIFGMGNLLKKTLVTSELSKTYKNKGVDGDFFTSFTTKIEKAILNLCPEKEVVDYAIEHDYK